MMKNGLVHRNQRGATVWRPLLIVLCKGEKYRFLTILYEKTCVLNCFFNYLYLVVPNICVNTHTHTHTHTCKSCNIFLYFVDKPRYVWPCRAFGILSAFR